MTDVIALAHRIAKRLDPITQELRVTVLGLLIDRYQIGTLTSASRMRRWRDGNVTRQVTQQGELDVTLTSPPTGGLSPQTPLSAPEVVFQVPESISKALGRCSFLGAAVTLRSAEFWRDFWRAEIRANPGVNYAQQILKAEAWVHSHWTRRPRKHPDRFLHNWLGNAEREEER